MNTLHFSIDIKAPKEKVWDTMLQDATYREWTKAFGGNSFFEGDWSEGSDIRFLSADNNGSVEGGVFSKIVKNTPFEHVSIQHLFVVQNGVEIPWDGDGFENYTLTEVDGGTKLDIDLINIPTAYMDMMNEMWPAALELLRDLCEK